MNNKCKYCDKEAEWRNPYNGMYLCRDHAIEKMNMLNDEFDCADTLKDWFVGVYKDYHDDASILPPGTWDLKNHILIQDQDLLDSYEV